ncbi:MAG TPA: TlpA disulfide reductase family protein, partial [Ferruginibacter sp.]|nr:TlpA disulfide reductase family protein [Ferruginibacter sp.]
LSSNDQKINNFSNLSFLSSNGLKLKLIDTSYNINMIVFWASWCAPCRKEIPTIKSIYKRYNDKRLKITNISIDTDTVAWRKTLRLENMPWEQLVTYNLNIDTIKEKFSFSSIPVIILTNYHGTEIYRFSNLTKVEEKKCIEIIDSYLTK